MANKTVTRVIPVNAVDEAREQIAEYRRFRDLSAEFIEVSTQLCDARLRMKKASSEPAQAEKGGSKKRSRPLLHELAGVLIDAKQVERTAERLGEEIRDDECSMVTPTAPLADTLYLGMDGTGVPVRPAELVGRSGKQPDGSAKTREVKLVTVWSAERRDHQGIPMRDRGSISYSAAIESAATLDTDDELSAFARRVAREARRRGFYQADRRVLLGDGAAWIWKLADELFPGAIQIVDLFHAKGHLWDVAKSVYGAGSEVGE